MKLFKIVRTNCVWNRPETKPLPHNIRPLFFKICINVASFRGSRRPFWTLFGAEQILLSTKNAIAPGFWSQWQIFIFLTPRKTDCPLVRLGLHFRSKGHVHEFLPIHEVMNNDVVGKNSWIRNQPIRVREGISKSCRRNASAIEQIIAVEDGDIQIYEESQNSVDAPQRQHRFICLTLFI